MSPSWEDFTLAFELFRDPILCGVIAGFALGLLAVHVVLRRMAFASATLSQAAGLGVALGFFAEIHLETHIHPTLSALGLALFTAWVLSMPVERLRLSRESLLAGAWLTAAAFATSVIIWLATGLGYFWPGWIAFSGFLPVSLMELLPRATAGRSGPRMWLMLNAALAAWTAVVLFLIWALGGGGDYWPAVTTAILALEVMVHAILIRNEPDEELQERVT